MPKTDDPAISENIFNFIFSKKCAKALFIASLCTYFTKAWPPQISQLFIIMKNQLWAGLGSRASTEKKFKRIEATLTKAWLKRKLVKSPQELTSPTA